MAKYTPSLMRLIVATAWLLAASSLVTIAQDSDSARPPSPDQKPRPLAIVGGDVYTITGGVIRRGTVLVRDGKIVEVGHNVTLPDGAVVVDAAGQYVVPGFIAMNVSNAGLRTVDRRGRIADALDPYDRNIKLLLGVGITAGYVQLGGAPQGRRFGEPAEMFLGLDDPQWVPDEEFGTEENVMLCPCCSLPILPTEWQEEAPTQRGGQQQQRSAVIRMSYGHLPAMLVRENIFYDASAGDLMGSLNRHNWRDQIAKARQYLKEVEAHQQATRDGNRQQPPRMPVSEDIVRLVKKESALRVRANTVSEIREMIQLARELDYRMAILGAIEGWLVAQELADASVPVIITPRQRRFPQPGMDDQSGSSIELSGILEKSGVPFAFSTLSTSVSLDGIAGRDLTSLVFEAVFAVRGGASERAALEGLTINAARMLGVDDRLGSIEPGKDADLLILNGPPLDYRSYVEKAYIAGKLCYERAADQVFPVFDR